MSRTLLFLLIVTALAFSRGASAQVVAGGGYYPYGVYDGGHASTAAEGFANGMGNVIQSAGSYNLNTSQAAINMTQARSQQLDNNLKGTQTYFEMRRVNTAARKAEESKGLTTEDSWRVAQMYLPKRLTAAQLDPVTGQINWPIMLRDPKYNDYRKQLDQLFVLRETSHGSIGYDAYMQIQQITTALLNELKKGIDAYNSTDYIKMKNFVESLAYEAKLPAV